MTALAAGRSCRRSLAGEDRTLGQGLFVDLIPSTSWFTNVRSAVSERDWFRIRKMVYRRAGQRCEACGAGADKARAGSWSATSGSPTGHGPGRPAACRCCGG